MGFYKKGDDYIEDDVDHPTYGITCGEWVNQIEVYGDESLRNRLITLLNGQLHLHPEQKLAFTNAITDDGVSPKGRGVFKKS